MISDVEAIVTSYLAAETGARVMGETPADLDEPWVRVTQLDASNEAVSRPEHLIAYMLQLECYAGEGTDGQEQAQTLAAEVRDALARMEGKHGGATISGVRFAGMPRVPDTTLEPARQRFILTAHVFAHA